MRIRLDIRFVQVFDGLSFYLLFWSCHLLPRQVRLLLLLILGYLLCHIVELIHLLLLPPRRCFLRVDLLRCVNHEVGSGRPLGNESAFFDVFLVDCVDYAALFLQWIGLLLLWLLCFLRRRHILMLTLQHMLRFQVYLQFLGRALTLVRFHHLGYLLLLVENYRLRLRRRRLEALLVVLIE